MQPLLTLHPAILRLTVAVFMTGQMLGWITYAQTGSAAELARPAAPPPMPNSLPNVRRTLREFDRFLDHHPLLEERLRLDSRLAATPAFLEQNSELRDFLLANPNVTDGLKVYPRYFLNRALLRQANVPLKFQELAPFKDLFQQQPGLEQELIENPELIRDPDFWASRPALRAFFARNAPLARVFQPSSVLL